MDWIIFILLIASFPLLYVVNRNGYYIYSLLYPFVGYFLLNKVGYALAYTSANAQLLSIIFIIIVFGRFKKNSGLYITYIVVYFLYFIFDSLLQEASPVEKLNTYKKSFFIMMWGVMLLEDMANRKVSIPKLRSFFINLVIFEIVLGGLQYLFEPIRDFFQSVHYTGIDGQLLDLPDPMKNGFMFGTFSGGANYAIFLSASFSLLCLFFLAKKMVKTEYWIILALIVITILFSGVRSPLLVSVIIFIYVIFKYQRQLAKPLLFIGLLCFIIFGGIPVGDVDNIRKVGFEEGGVARSLALLNSFDGDRLAEETTFGFTICMFPYILMNPLFGVGFHQKGGYWLALYSDTLETYSLTDAMLFFTLAEIGLIGVIIYLWPLGSFIRMTGDYGGDKKKYVILLLSLILMTFVDAGFMDTNMLYLYFFSVAFWFVPNQDVIVKKISGYPQRYSKQIRRKKIE